MMTIRADRLQATEREAGSGKREAMNVIQGNCKYTGKVKVNRQVTRIKREV
jgi:hypothetical protein